MRILRLRRAPRCLTFLAVWAALCGGALAQAPAAWSHGVQDIPIGYEACRQRAHAALQAAGFAVDVQGGAWTGGPKGVNRAAIFCFGTGPASSGVGIHVMANSHDPGVPGAERVRLQQLMASGLTTPPTPVAGELAGNWNWSTGCPEGGYSGQIRIGPLGPDGSFSGNFSDVGTLAGQLRGNRLEFVRRGHWFGRDQEQHWSGSFTGTGVTGGRIVRPTEARADCAFQLKR